MVEKCAAIMEEIIQNGHRGEADPFVLSERKMKNGLEGSALKPKRLTFANANSPSRNIQLLQSN